jgi:hypothetical protein
MSDTFVTISQIRRDIKSIEKLLEAGKSFKLLIHNKVVGTFIPETTKPKAVIDCGEVLIPNEDSFAVPIPDNQYNPYDYSLRTAPVNNDQDALELSFSMRQRFKKYLAK